MKPLSESNAEEGIFVKVLQFNKQTKRAPTFLLKFDAGATYPAHNHPAREEIFVIGGDIYLGKDHLQAGDYLYTIPNGKYTVRSENGCVVLVKTLEAVEILPNRKTKKHE